jgi:hypothetical protein
MVYTSLNQILNIVKSISQNHSQVNGYMFGEESDISASEQELYPLVWSNLLPSSISESTLTVNINLLVLDIQKADQSNEQDTLSDTFSICQDIWAALNSPAYYDRFVMQESVQLETIREGLPDLVNGWRMTLSFDLPQTQNRCQIP